MSKSKGVRKSVLKKQAEFRKNHQGVLRKKSQGAAMVRKMKEFNKFIDKAIKDGKIVGHQEAGLPEVIGDVEIKVEHTIKEVSEEENRGTDVEPSI